MAETLSPIQRFSLFKVSAAVFALEASLVILILPMFIPLQTIQSFAPLIVVVNITVAAMVGWRIYKTSSHTVFSFDANGFSIKRGKSSEVSHKWSEFSTVTLVRNEYGEFSVRLYRDKESFDIPASRLRLDPYSFRLRVADILKRSRSSRS